MKKWYEQPIITYIFYALAVIMLIFAIINTVWVKDYIAGLETAGKISASGDLSEIIQYYGENALSYYIYTIMFVFCGYVISLLKSKKN